MPSNAERMPNSFSSPIAARIVGGRLRIEGRTDVDYWAGRTLLSQGAFTIAPGYALEVEVERLKRLVAELMLDKQMLQDIAKKKW